MSYIGKGLKSVSSANVTVDTMVGDGVVNTLALSQSGVESVKDVSVYYQGISQVPNVDYTLSASTVTFTTTPATGMKVVVVTRGDSTKDRINDASVTATSFADGSVTNSKIVGLDASKLTGTLPAISGAALTNKVIPEPALESSASNPASDSNKSLGAVWVNTTSGQMWVCTDATTDQNTWTNIGSGSGHIPWPPPRFSQGSVNGFIAGGDNNSSTTHKATDINKFSFSSEGNATDHGDLTYGRNATCGASSGTHGYTGAGYAHSSLADGPTNQTKRNDKFAYASSGNAVQVGDLTVSSYNLAGHESAFLENGYFSGGSFHEPASYNGYGWDKMCKFAFASDSSTETWSSLHVGVFESTGTSSNTSGYCAGGNPYSGSTNMIQKFDFANEGVKGDVGNLTGAREELGGSNSATHGYSSGGRNNGPRTNTIDKFAFASDANAVYVGYLTDLKYASCGFSGMNDGYDCAGQYQVAGVTSVIEKYSFASDNNASAVGNLMNGQPHIPAGTQSSI